MQDQYNYGGFDAKTYDLDRFDKAQLGHKAPDGPVLVLGRKTRLLEFDGAFLVLELGSLTCPLFQSRRDGMDSLMAEFPDLTHGVLYIREAHPGARIPAHQSVEDKIARAAELRADGEKRVVFVDGLDGALHESFGSYPNAVFIINRNGCIVYRSAWNNPRATAAALRRLLKGKPAGREGLMVPARPAIARQTLRAAGPGAGLDFLRSFPRLVWKNLIKRNLRLIFTGHTGPTPDTGC